MCENLTVHSKRGWGSGHLEVLASYAAACVCSAIRGDNSVSVACDNQCEKLRIPAECTSTERNQSSQNYRRTGRLDEEAFHKVRESHERCETGAGLAGSSVTQKHGTSDISGQRSAPTDSGS